MENLEPWRDFTYQNFLSRYAHHIHQQKTHFDPVLGCEDTSYEEIFSEDCLRDVVSSTVRVTVSYALPRHLFVGSGAKTSVTTEGKPDWAGGNRNKRENGKSKPLIIGDDKYCWPHKQAIAIVQRTQGEYDQDSYTNILGPLEQVQYYGKRNNCRYVALQSEGALILFRLRLSNELGRTSPRPNRNARRVPGHQRGLSISTMSEVVSSTSDVSVPSSIVQLAAHVSAMEYAIIPWEGRREDGMTMKLALYCIALLANEGNDLRSEYEPLGPHLLAPEIRLASDF